VAYRLDQQKYSEYNHRFSGPADEEVEMPNGPRSGVGSVDDRRIAGLIEPVIAVAGMDLESVRTTVAGRRRLLRIVVDSDHGVSLDDAADVSREVSAVLDAANALGEIPYTLEVSSPGVDRPLTEPRHWRRAAGRLVKVKVTGEGVLEGRVLAADADGVMLDLAEGERRLGYGLLGAGAIQIEFGRIPDAELEEFVDDTVPDNDTDLGAGTDGH
jgi:ribosome maturation factor RimP